MTAADNYSAFSVFWLVACVFASAAFMASISLMNLVHNISMLHGCNAEMDGVTYHLRVTKRHIDMVNNARTWRFPLVPKSKQKSEKNKA